MLGVVAVTAKLLPKRVTLLDPEPTTLSGLLKLTTGASNVKRDCPAYVPTTVLTVTFARAGLMIAVVAVSRHATVVAEDQEAVEHRSMLLAVAVAVKLYDPKFSPVIVTDEPPDVALFKPPNALTTGPSNVNRLAALVPTAALTVTFE